VSENTPLTPVVVDLNPMRIDTVVPGSVRFEFRGRTYVDRGGSLYYGIDPDTGAGTYAGSLDYTTGRARVTAWAAGAANGIIVRSLLTRLQAPGIDSIAFRAPGSPLRPGSFTLRATTVRGVQLNASADINGTITGTNVTGVIDWQSGAAYVRFGALVDAAGNESEPWFDAGLVSAGKIWRPMLVLPETVFFGTVVYRSIPLNPVTLGLDPVRLPSDGRVLAFRPGQTALVHHTAVASIASPTPGQQVDLGRTNLSRVEVRDANNTPVDSIWYVIDHAGGKVTFANPLNLGAYTLPIRIRHRIEDRVLVADAQITGEIAVNRALTHAYPAGSFISTCLILGEANGSQDLQARVQNVFDQYTWTAEFSDARIGAGTDAQYNDLQYPIEVNNSDAITERWAVHFTSATQFELIGETVGIIATGSTTEDLAPLNPRTGRPYVRLRWQGWGGGWSAGNVLRFNTIGGLAPVWFIRTTLAGEMEAPTDAFRFEVIGDATP